MEPPTIVNSIAIVFLFVLFTIKTVKSYNSIKVIQDVLDDIGITDNISNRSVFDIEAYNNLWKGSAGNQIEKLNDYSVDLTVLDSRSSDNRKMINILYDELGYEIKTADNLWTLVEQEKLPVEERIDRGELTEYLSNNFFSDEIAEDVVDTVIETVKKEESE